MQTLLIVLAVVAGGVYLFAVLYTALYVLRHADQLGVRRTHFPNGERRHAPRND